MVLQYTYIISISVTGGSFTFFEYMDTTTTTYYDTRHHMVPSISSNSLRLASIRQILQSCHLSKTRSLLAVNMPLVPATKLDSVFCLVHFSQRNLMLHHESHHRAIVNIIPTISLTCSNGLFLFAFWRVVLFLIGL